MYIYDTSLISNVSGQTQLTFRPMGISVNSKYLSTTKCWNMHDFFPTFGEVFNRVALSPPSSTLSATIPVQGAHSDRSGLFMIVPSNSNF